MFRIQPRRFNINRCASINRVFQPARFNPLISIASGASGCGTLDRISLVSEAFETRTPRLRNFDTESPFSYCYELQSVHRLG